MVLYKANKETLEPRLASSGLKIDYIVDTLGITRQGFAKKRCGNTLLRKAEVFVLCTLLHIPTEDIPIFFTEKVETEVDGEEE